VDTGFGSAFNIARTVKSLIKYSAAAMHGADRRLNRSLSGRHRAASLRHDLNGYLLNP
jgi:2-methylisocitrate lyase-like PEP mutase family enzyme